ncbi:MAG TPA: BON domain-containing protein [Nitrospiria bacterium]|nr:BON domain-containing protein [Nitrospiria bacterium]
MKRHKTTRYLLCVLIGAVALTMGGGVSAQAAKMSATVTHIKADSWMRWKIDSLLQNDPYLDYRGVKVKIKQKGVAVLTGYVLTDYEKAHAAEVAGDVPGVTEVKNEIMVVQYTAGHDGAVAQRVRSQIIQDPTMKAEALEVEAEKDGVILHGIVKTADQKEQIGKFVSEVQGVKHVDNDIDVEPVS